MSPGISMTSPLVLDNIFSASPLPSSMRNYAYPVVLQQPNFVLFSPSDSSYKKNKSPQVCDTMKPLLTPSPFRSVASIASQRAPQLAPVPAAPALAAAASAAAAPPQQIVAEKRDSNGTDESRLTSNLLPCDMEAHIHEADHESVWNDPLLSLTAKPSFESNPEHKDNLFESPLRSPGATIASSNIPDATPNEEHIGNLSSRLESLHEDVVRELVLTAPAKEHPRLVNAVVNWARKIAQDPLHLKHRICSGGQMLKKQLRRKDQSSNSKTPTGNCASDNSNKHNYELDKTSKNKKMVKQESQEQEERKDKNKTDTPSASQGGTENH